jgi:hypothetical protein
MNSPLLRRVLLVGLSTSALAAPAAHAAVPTAYKGTPYKGTPQEIPGRVELVDMDLGGKGVAWDTDWNRGNSAQYEPISGNDYRPDDKNLPNICKTNAANKDYYVGGDMKPYPSTTPTKEAYYMGYAHAGDWVRMTVNVKTAGKYNVSSTWASDTANWGLSIWFNDGSDPAAPMDGVNKTGVLYMPGTSNYHLWKDYPNFTQVTLTAGLQIMTFKVEREPHLQYGFLQFDLADAAPTGAAGTGGSTTGSAGTGGGAGTGGASTGSAGTGGPTTGEAGTGGSATGEAGTGGSTSGAAGTGSSTGAAGTGTSTAGAAGTGGGAAGTSGGGGRDSGGGCVISGAASRGYGAAGVGLLLLGLMAARRRRAR